METQWDPKFTKLNIFRTRYSQGVLMQNRGPHLWWHATKSQTNGNIDKGSRGLGARGDYAPVHFRFVSLSERRHRQLNLVQTLALSLLVHLVVVTTITGARMAMSYESLQPLPGYM